MSPTRRRFLAIALAALAPATPACKSSDKPAAGDAGSAAVAARPGGTDAAPAAVPVPPVTSDAAVAAGPADAAPALPGVDRDQPCPATVVTAARKAGAEHLKAKRYAEAVAVLAAPTQQCLVTADGQDKARDEAHMWLVSDLGLAYLKAGRPLDCTRLYAPVLYPMGDLARAELTDSKVGKAIAHNDGLCRKAGEATAKDFTERPCSLAASGKAWAVPDGVAGLAGACVQLLPAKAEPDLDADDTDDASKYCPRVTLLRPGGGKPAALTASEGVLVSTSDCCNLERLQVAARGGQLVVRALGAGRDCFGGTAHATYDALYEVDAAGGTLKQLADRSVQEH